MKRNHLSKALENFKGKKVLVVGDLILDRFITGVVSRISPEAPVPVVEVRKEEHMPGGAGNVVCNLVKLGANAVVSGVVGRDFYGKELISLLQETGADISGIVKDSGRPTSIKTRIIAEHQQVVRTDKESREELDGKYTERLIKKLDSEIKNIDGIIISDYGKGLITTKLIEGILSFSRKKDLPVVVDPQIGHFFEYKKVTSITPNIKEAGSALNMDITDSKTLMSAGEELLRQLECETVLITRGEEGMSLFYSDGYSEHIPTAAKQVFDVTGAGDTVASVFTLGLASGLNYFDSAVLANFAAAVVVAKLGTATATKDEILREMGFGK